MEAIAVALIEKLSFIELLIILLMGAPIFGIFKTIKITSKLLKSNTERTINLEGRVEEVERVANGVSKALWGVQKDLNAIRTQTAEIRGTLYGFEYRNKSSVRGSNKS